MNAPIRLILALAVVVPLAVCVFGLRFSFEVFSESLRNARHAEELEQWRQCNLRLFQSRDQLARDVIAQRCSLREALERLQESNREWFQELERESPDYNSDLRFCRQQWSKPDWHYLQITAYVKNLLFDRPEEADAVLHRLEKEYQQLHVGRPAPRLLTPPGSPRSWLLEPSRPATAERRADRLVLPPADLQRRAAFGKSEE